MRKAIYKSAISRRIPATRGLARQALLTRLINRKRMAPPREQTALPLTSLIYAISHEMRAPMRHIEGYVHALREQGSPDLSGKYLEGIDRATVKMNRMIDGLLALAHAANDELHCTKLSLDLVVRAAIDSLANDTASRQIAWKIHPLREVNGDSVLLGVVIRNLLSNAIKFSTARTCAEIEIGCRSIAVGETVYFVRDNGVGFDMKYSDKLCGLFQRLHSEKEYSGVGAGLAVAQCIVRRHGGKLWANANPNAGAEFCFTLGER